MQCVLKEFAAIKLFRRQFRPIIKNGFDIFSGAVAVGSKGGLGNQDGEPRRVKKKGTKTGKNTGNQDGEHVQGTKTGNQDEEPRRGTKTGNKDMEQRRGTKTGNQDRSENSPKITKKNLQIQKN